MKYRIEFHERKSSNLIQPYIETRIYVENLEEFLKFCARDSWDGTFGVGGNFVYKMKDIKRSKAKQPKFDLSIRQKKIIVYPKENLITGIECRLHYICQHSFDMFPESVRNNFYGYDINKQKIGVLYTLKGEKLDVYNTDILDGFMLNSELEKSFKLRFTNWIRYRRGQD